MLPGRSVVKSRLKGKTYYEIMLKTRVLACFKELHNLFYKDKIKVILENIYDLLIPIALARTPPGFLHRGFAPTLIGLCVMEQLKIKD